MGIASLGGEWGGSGAMGAIEDVVLAIGEKGFSPRRSSMSFKL